MNLKPYIKKIVILGILITIPVLFFVSGAYKYLSFEQLKIHRGELMNFVNEWKYAAPLIYLGLYALMTAFSIPGGLVMTISGGLLFGALYGALFTVTGATIGATLVFSAVKLGFGKSLKKSTGGFLDKMREGFEKNSFSYLMVLRILPLFPFWLVNIVPAFLDVKLKVFIIATFLGIIPGTYVYSSIGEGLDTVLSSGQTPNFNIIFEPQVLTPLIGLAILSLLPIFKNKIMKWFVK